MLLYLIDHLNIQPQDTVFVAIAREINDTFHLGHRLRTEYPKLDIRLLDLRFETRGAAETLFIVSQSMTAAERDRRVVSVDCDTLYWPNSRLLSRVRNLPPGQGATAVFEHDGDPPVYSCALR